MIHYYEATTKSRSVERVDKYKPGLWVYIESPKHSEMHELAKKLELDEGHLEDAMDSDELPRLEREGDQTYLFTRFVHTDDNLILTTTPLLFILHPDGLVTVSLDAIPHLDKLIDGKISVDTMQPGRLLLQILDVIDSQFEEHLSDITKQIRATRSRLRVDAIRNQDFIDFVTIEDELNEFMTALNPMSSILKRVLLGKHFKLHNSDKDLVEDLLLNNEQSLANCRSNTKSVVNIREAYSTIMSNNLNQIIRVLTVVTVVISVPTLIASIYGMNVHLPFEGSANAFAGLIVFSVVISVGLLWYLKHRKWF